MGSTSSGKFKDYPPSKGKKQKDEGGSGGHDSSGSSDRGLGREDQCTRDLVNVALEEVGRSAYFQAHNRLPIAGTTVRLRAERVGPRLSIDLATGESVGFLPTEYNYLLVCMKKGFTYSGEVVSLSESRIPSVRVNLQALRHGR